MKTIAPKTKTTPHLWQHSSKTKGQQSSFGNNKNADRHQKKEKVNGALINFQGVLERGEEGKDDNSTGTPGHALMMIFFLENLGI